MVVFDVDGTITAVPSCWRYIHEHLGTWSKAKIYAELFFRGEITYLEWALLDVGLWRGIPLEKIKHILNKIPYTEGAIETLRTLKDFGMRIVFISAGLTLLTDRVCKDIEVDYAIANELVAKNGILTGEVKINVDYDGKAKILRRLLKEFNIKSRECVAVGDDETVIPLFKMCGQSIAYDPKTKKVEENAKIIVRAKDLRKIIPHIIEEKHIKSENTSNV